MPLWEGRRKTERAFRPLPRQLQRGRYGLRAPPMGPMDQAEDGGRVITKMGQRELDTAAVQAAEVDEHEDE